MEACFLTSSSFTNSIRIVSSAKPKSFAPHPKSDSALAQPKNSVSSLSIKCCNFEYSSPFEDVAGRFTNSDWRSFRARLVAGERASRPGVPLPSSLVDLDTPADRPSPVVVGDKWAHVIREPEKGCLLIATEKLDGAHIFERAVVLLLSTGPVGPTGVILNRPSLMSIKESESAVLNMGGTFSERPLYFGGPIEAGLFLMRGGNEEVGKSGVFEEVMEGLYYGRKESGGCAAEMVKRGVVGVDDFRFFEGCCGWAKGQLSDEIRAGYWTVAASSRSVVGLGSVGSVGLWGEVLGLMGPEKVW